MRGRRQKNESDQTLNVTSTPISGIASNAGGIESDIPQSVTAPESAPPEFSSGDQPQRLPESSSNPNSSFGGGEGSVPDNRGSISSDSNNSVNSDNSGNQETPPDVTDTETVLRQLLRPEYDSGEDRADCSENGWYRCQRLGDDRDAYGITYLDFALKQEIVLCPNSACRHNNETCNAFISEQEMFYPSLFISNGSLWALSTENDSDGGMGSGGRSDGSETRRAAIYRMDLDGMNRQKVYEAGQGNIIEENVFEYGDDLLFIEKTPTVETCKNNRGEDVMFYGSKNRALLRYSIAANKIVERIPLDPYKNIALEVRGCASDSLILSGTAYPDGKSRYDLMEILAYDTRGGSNTSQQNAIINDSEQVIFTLNIDTKEFKEVTRFKNKDHKSYNVDSGKVYMESSGAVCILDPLSGERRDVKIPSGYEYSGVFMDKLELYSESKGDRISYYADLDGKNLTSSKLFDYLSDDQLTLATVTDDKAVVYYDMEKENSLGGGVKVTGRKLGIISKNDLLNGRRNLVRVKALD